MEVDETLGRWNVKLGRRSAIRQMTPAERQGGGPPALRRDVGRRGHRTLHRGARRRAPGASAVDAPILRHSELRSCSNRRYVDRIAALDDAVLRTCRSRSAITSCRPPWQRASKARPTGAPSPPGLPGRPGRRSAKRPHPGLGRSAHRRAPPRRLETPPAAQQIGAQDRRRKSSAWFGTRSTPTPHSSGPAQP
jgi:hypothetical protein